MRKEKLLQIASLIVIELLILLPVYVAAQANTTDPPVAMPVGAGTDTITADAPLWVDSNRVLC